jgi:alpha,alpha-trehalase
MTVAWQSRVLREHSFMPDGDRGAIVGPDGAIVWQCLPAWDSPAVLSALLGWQGGYAITPADPRYVRGVMTGGQECGRRYYRP